MRKPWHPEAEIRFAARSGFLTRELWLKFFAGEAHRSWTQRRWKRLTADGFFLKHPSAYGYSVIIPNEKAPLVQRLCPGGVARYPFVAQIRHDEVLFEGILGLSEFGLVNDYLTEAELKSSEATGAALAKDEAKLPDVLLTTQGGSRLAVEIELTQKSKRRYWKMLNAYRARRDVDAILFVIQSRAIIRAVLAAAHEVMFPLKEIPIGFMSNESWCIDPAKRKMSLGETTTTLESIARHYMRPNGF